MHVLLCLQLSGKTAGSLYYIVLVYHRDLKTFLFDSVYGHQDMD